MHARNKSHSNSTADNATTDTDSMNKMLAGAFVYSLMLRTNVGVVLGRSLKKTKAIRGDLKPAKVKLAVLYHER